jgi:hypothetical protein
VSVRATGHRRGPLAAALAISLAVHLALAGVAPIAPPRLESIAPGEPVPVAVRLLPPVSADSVPARAARPGPSRTSAPVAAPAASAAAITGLPVDTPSLPSLQAPPPAATPAQVPTPPRPGADPMAGPAAGDPPAAGAAGPGAPIVAPSPLAMLPARGRLEYAISTGSPAMPVGRATYAWTVVDGRYRLELEARTTGLVGWLRPAAARQWSEGELDERGLRPARFHLERGDGRPPEGAVFDWPRQRLAFGRAGETREAPLAEGTQDALSLMLHLAFAPPADARRALWLATGRSLHRQSYAASGALALETPAGSFRTVHLRRESATEDDDGYDLWLAEDRPWLPVRIRWTDRRGRITDAVLDTLELPPR